jgi:outer membrane receptor protein involved in Fe transport
MTKQHGMKTMIRKVSASRGCLALSGLLVASAATAAEDIFDMPLESLMEVRVSVTSPFSESVMDAASSVSVLRPASWQAQGARSLEEALERVPSVVPYASLGGASMFAIRGYANEISVRGTAMQLDGVPLNSFSYSTAAYSLPFVSLSLLERVEMIRGAGSTLYGSDAFHGVIALNTWQPSSGHREARVAAGSPGHSEQAVAYALDAGAFRASAGVASTHNGDAGIRYGYADPATGAPGHGEWQNIEQDDSAFLRVETGNARDGLWRAGFFADAYDGESFPGTGTQFHRALLPQVQAFSADFLEGSNEMGQASNFWLAQVQHQRELRDDLSLDVRTFVWQNDQTWVLKTWEYPEDNELVASNGTPLLCRRSPTETGVSPLYCPHTQYQGTSERRSGLHALLRYDGGGSTQWALGAGRDWFDVLAAPVRRVGVDGTVYYNSPAPFEGVERSINHLLVQARTDAGNWAYVYGVRWDGYSDVNEGAASPRLAVIYRQPGAQWNTKLLYGHAFRAPSAAEQYGSGGGTQQLAGQNLEPETIDTLELVWQLRQENTDTEVVLFGSRWLDGIVLVPVSPGVNQYVNSGDNSAQGIELVHQRGFGRWRLEGNVSWVFSQNKQTGLEYTGFPAYLTNLSITRALPAGWRLSLNERAMFDMAQGDTLGAYVPPKARDYFRTDFHLGWQRDDVQLAFDVRNLLNRDNVVPSMFNANGGTPEPGIDVLMSISLTL